MLLHELTGVKSQKNKTAFEILEKLKHEHGITYVNGSFGFVMTHPTWKHVVKFFPKDDHYLKFVNYCVDNPSPHLPQFVKKPKKMRVFFEKAKDADELDNFFVVKIEKLTKIPTEIHNEIVRLYNYIQTDGYQEVVGTKEEDKFLAKFRLGEYKALAHEILELSENKPSGSFMDLHDGNIMMRGNIPVIVDPYGSFDQDHSISLYTIISNIGEISSSGLTKTAMVDEYSTNLSKYFSNRSN